MLTRGDMHVDFGGSLSLHDNCRHFLSSIPIGKGCRLHPRLERIDEVRFDSAGCLVCKHHGHSGAGQTAIKYGMNAERFLAERGGISSVGFEEHLPRRKSTGQAE